MVCGENGADAYVVGSGRNRGFCLFRAVRGQAYDLVRAEQAAYLLHGKILLPDVHAVGIREQGDVHMVVNDEARAGFQRQTAQQSAFLKHASGMRVLFAVLKNFYSGIA